MTNSVDLTALLRINNQGSSKPVDITASKKDSYSFKDSLKDAVRDSLKDAVRDQSMDGTNNEGNAALRKDLISRVESKLKSLKRPETKKVEAEKPVKEHAEKKTDKLKQTMEELLLKLEELSKLQQQGEIPKDMHISLLEGIKETLKEIETMQANNTTGVHPELQSKISGLETKLDVMLQELKINGRLLSKETGAEFVKELKAAISDNWVKFEAVSETHGAGLTEETPQVENISSYEAAANQVVTEKVSDKEASFQTQVNIEEQLDQSKPTADTASKQEVIKKVASPDTKKEDKTVQTKPDKAPDEVKEAVDGKVEKVTAEKKDNRRQDEDAEGGKEAPRQTPKAAHIIQHKPVNLEMPATKLDQAAVNKIENVPVKIPNPKAETVNKADLINQIVKKAEVILSDAKQEMRMQLEPESLGKLTLKLAVEKGLITAKFVAESQQVKQVIESNLNELRDMLQEKGLEVQNFSVSVGQDNKGYNSENALHQWKETIRLSSRNQNSVNYDGYQEGVTAQTRTINPYSIHSGKFDHRA